MNYKVTIKTTISNNRNETATIFKQICDAVITSYLINIFSVGTLFTKVIKIIDQHDRLLRYPRHCSKVFQESNALQQQQTMFFERISDADVTSYPIQFFSTGTIFTKVIKIIDQHDRLLRYPRHCSKVFQESNALQQQQTMFFRRISDADVTSYSIQFFSTGTLFAKVIKIIDQHDRLLRYARLFSKIFKNGTPETTANISSTQRDDF